ncbi:3-isopropylmalate dehydratase small subunit [Prochlorococcus marinus]|uniref:3-isopropylmalate dehydratase n=1 Tax=Prochlorococcus marinus (strain MIT 9211) TaxID=93059 RepID=A9BDM6_PROM4|nr:3-isopropylmalate dehydratase small subunit [Prochlorococcus marinus]ABX08212.1 3-isopropylmalate dehydratase small subunit [Prochlorococcus marinus str. MIT 9211]
MSSSYTFPKGCITLVKGKSIILKGNDIDTDRIIPARFLKCVSFDNLGENVFADDRKEKNGSHVFDIEENKGASILIVNKNFGCGSSREHAPQALMRWGIRAIIGNSFAEIFHGNCLSLGIPCVTLIENELSSLIESIENSKSKYFCSINLRKKLIEFRNQSWKLKIEEGAALMLNSGNWDATSTLMSQKEKINLTKSTLPYLNQYIH